MPKLRTKPLVLLVEDEELISRMYSIKLQHDGYDCLIANDGEEGVKLAKQEKPDLILCDIMMPKKDGIAALEEIKADPETKTIPVIMLSNLAEEVYVQSALELGAVSFIIKASTEPSDVVAKIKQVLQGSGKIPLITG